MDSSVSGDHVKVFFELEQDEDGYPPETQESMWAVDLGGGLYRIDNIPFFAVGISDGDVVRAAERDGELMFRDLVEPSDNCTIRLIMFEKGREDEVRAALTGLGCEIEGTGIKGLFALNFHKDRYGEVARYLRQGFDADIFDYEEASLR